MKLPEEMPNDLRDKLADTVEKKCVPYVVKHIPVDAIHRVFASYYNNLPVDWRPVSEKPFQSMNVWLWDGEEIYKGEFIESYGSGCFIPQLYGYKGASIEYYSEDENGGLYLSGDTYEADIIEDDSITPTHWTYAYLPEPPKE